MAHPRNPPPYRRKNLAKISYASRVIAHFVPNFVAMAMGVSRGKMQWQHSMAHPRKPPYRRKNLAKNLLRKPCYGPFCPKFRCHGNQGGSGIKLNDTIRLAIPKKHTLKNFWDIFVPIGGFGGMGHRMLPIAFFLDRPPLPWQQNLGQN